MIGSELVRFHPEIRRKQDGYGLVGTVWKTIQDVGPTILKDVTLAGIKGLKELSIYRNRDGSLGE